MTHTQTILAGLYWLWIYAIVFNYSALAFISVLSYLVGESDSERPWSRFWGAIKKWECHTLFALPAPIASLIVIWFLPTVLKKAWQEYKINKRRK